LKANLKCEDFADHGVLLIPSETGDYEATLVNRSDAPIADWRLVWEFFDANGTRVRHSTFGFCGCRFPSVLLPFGLDEQRLRQDVYWRTVLPGSKRLLTASGETIGDNRDVRPPEPDEIERHGGFGGASGGFPRRTPPVASAVLSIDALFFADGRFLGPNRSGLWELVVGTANAAMFIGRVAALEGTVDAVWEAAGPAPEFPGPKMKAREWISKVVHSMCRNEEDVQGVQSIARWADAVPPHYVRVQ